MSSKQAAVPAMDSHVSVQIPRLTESQEAKFALIRFFATAKFDGRIEIVRSLFKVGLTFLPVNSQMLGER